MSRKIQWQATSKDRDSYSLTRMYQVPEDDRFKYALAVGLKPEVNMTEVRDIYKQVGLSDVSDDDIKIEMQIALDHGYDLSKLEDWARFLKTIYSDRIAKIEVK